ncbi:MAG: outer membrane protein assembly factor BamD [Bacteroidota bacterium]
MYKQTSFKSNFIIILVILTLSSCSQYQKLLKSDDVMLKKEKAIEYFEKEDYSRSLGLLTDIIPAFRGTSHAEELNYYFALAHYNMGDYTMAAHYFKSFTESFPRSEHNEEFNFLSAYSKYLLSPRPSLDQTPTREAINELQQFANKYPESEKIEEVNELIDELRLKLEKKNYDSAKLYYNLGDYMAAVRSFKNLINDFPDTEFREEAMFLIMRAHFLYAENSVREKQLERYTNVVEAYEDLIKRYPESSYLDDAEQMNARAIKQIELLDDSVVIKK